MCRICVKPSYKHCDSCKRCAQVSDHDCKCYKENIICYICMQKGHSEGDCNLLKKIQLKWRSKKEKRKKGNCFLCSEDGHTHRECPDREAFLNDIS